MARESGCFAPALSGPIIGLSALSVLFELAGMFSLLPLLQFIQADQDLTRLAAQSRPWRIAADWAATAGVPIRIWSLALVTLALIVARQAVFYASNLRTAVLRERFVQHLRIDLAQRLLGAQPATIQSVGSGAFVTMVSAQTVMASLLVPNLSQLVIAVLSFLAYALSIAVLSPGIIVMGVASGVIVVLMLQRFVRATYRINQRLVIETEALGRYLAQLYQAWRLIKLTDRLEPMLGQLSMRTGALCASNVELARTSGRVQLFAMPIAAALALAILAVAISILKLTIAELTLILVVLFRLGPMAEAFVRLRQGQAAAVTALTRLDDIATRSDRERESDTGTKAFQPPERWIRLQGVSFRYAGRERAALRDVTLDIPANRMTAIIGPSGAGKSTLVDLLPRLVQPDAGSILFDATPISDFRLSALRRGVGVVDQHSVLFDATLAENLRFTKADATEAEMHSALEQAAALDILAALPGGLDGGIGENGAQLSGGQRQRLAIARAFLGGARVLVLDEPTSALDFEAEAQFRRSIAAIRASGRHTVIVVAHRLSTIRDADVVVVLREGAVEEAAPPSALQHEEGYYARMVEADGADRPAASGVPARKGTA